jgi:WD40 repeat protein
VSDPARPSQLGQPLTTGTGTGDNVNSVAFTPDGKILATGDDSGDVRLWDVSDPARHRQLGQPLATGTGNGVVSVAFTPDGKTLASSESGGIAQIWSLDVSYAISRVCDLASGVLTLQQWHQYIPQLQYDPPCPNYR